MPPLAPRDDFVTYREMERAIRSQAKATDRLRTDVMDRFADLDLNGSAAALRELAKAAPQLVALANARQEREGFARYLKGHFRWMVPAGVFLATPTAWYAINRILTLVFG